MRFLSVPCKRRNVAFECIAQHRQLDSGFAVNKQRVISCPVRIIFNPIWRFAYPLDTKIAFRFSSAPESEPEGDFGIQRVRKTPDRIEDYANRTGYNPLFIDGKTRIELPVLSDALKCDVATFAWNG